MYSCGESLMMCLDKWISKAWLEVNTWRGIIVWFWTLNVTVIFNDIFRGSASVSRFWRTCASNLLIEGSNNCSHFMHSFRMPSGSSISLYPLSSSFVRFGVRLIVTCQNLFCLLAQKIYRCLILYVGVSSFVGKRDKLSETTFCVPGIWTIDRSYSLNPKPIRWIILWILLTAN